MFGVKVKIYKTIRYDGVCLHWREITFLDKNILLQAVSYPGALVMIDGNAQEIDLLFIAGLTAYFGKGRDAVAVKVSVKSPGLEERIIEISPLDIKDISQKWYV